MRPLIQFSIWKISTGQILDIDWCIYDTNNCNKSAKHFEVVWLDNKKEVDPIPPDPFSRHQFAVSQQPYEREKKQC